MTLSRNDQLRVDLWSAYYHGADDKRWRELAFRAVTSLDLDERNESRLRLDVAELTRAVRNADEWNAEARRTLDALGAFLQHIGASHRVDWREWIAQGRAVFDALPRRCDLSALGVVDGPCSGRLTDTDDSAPRVMACEAHRLASSRR